MRNSVLKIMGWTTVALVIPLLGNRFVEGWNWTWHDFVFAWVFWVAAALSILFIGERFRKYRMVIGSAVFLVFAAIWVALATG